MRKQEVKSRKLGISAFHPLYSNCESGFMNTILMFKYFSIVKMEISKLLIE